MIFYNIILLPYESYESFKFFKEENKINFKIKQKQFSFQNIYASTFNPTYSVFEGGYGREKLLDMIHNFKSYF